MRCRLHGDEALCAVGCFFIAGRQAGRAEGMDHMIFWDVNLIPCRALAKVSVAPEILDRQGGIFPKPTCSLSLFPAHPISSEAISSSLSDAHHLPVQEKSDPKRFRHEPSCISSGYPRFSAMNNFS
jgi:hypothetical protein